MSDENQQTAPAAPVDHVLARMPTEERGQLAVMTAALGKMRYSAALLGVLDAVRGVVAAVRRCDQAMQAAGIPEEGPPTEEERAVFASSQAMLAAEARRNPGLLLLFPPTPPEAAPPVAEEP